LSGKIGRLNGEDREAVAESALAASERRYTRHRHVHFCESLIYVCLLHVSHCRAVLAGTLDSLLHVQICAFKNPEWQ